MSHSIPWYLMMSSWDSPFFATPPAPKWPACGAILGAPGALIHGLVHSNPQKDAKSWGLLESIWKTIIYAILKIQLYFPAFFRKLTCQKNGVPCRFLPRIQAVKHQILGDWWNVSRYLLDVFYIQYGPIIPNHLSKEIATPKGQNPRKNEQSM